MNLLCHFCVGHLTLSTAKVESNVRLLKNKKNFDYRKNPIYTPNRTVADELEAS